MKRFYIYGLLVVSFLAASCSNWLDVTPKTEIESSELFSDEEGFKSALIGIYGRMLNGNLYGRELTFDLLEELAQRYDNGKYAQMDLEARKRYYDYTGDFTNISDFTASKTRLASIWEAMYKDIVNINNLLKYLDKNGEDVITTPGLYEIIKGEALGLRAFHYFDLLRMWGPADLVNNGSRKVVPYRTQVDYEKLAPISADSMILLIEKDLLEAETLLADDDCQWENNPEELFLAYRQHRMNKWALKGLMARFYLYTKQPAKAAEKAKAVVDSCGLSLVSSLKDCHSYYNECLFTLHYPNQEANIRNYFNKDNISAGSRTHKLMTPTWKEALFEVASVGTNDMRSKDDQGFITTTDAALLLKFTPVEDGQYNNRIPLIRLSEMYYILAETLNGSDALTYFNSVRNRRGISANNNITEWGSKEEMVEQLSREYAKDFIGEGQYFFFLKRHNMKKITVSSNIAPYTGVFEMRESYYEFEIPEAEKEYGYVPEED